MPTGFALPQQALQSTLPGSTQPNPGAFFVQLSSAAVIAAHIAAVGLGPNVFGDLAKLLTLNDPLLKRLYYVISIPGPIYGNAQGAPIGWYAAIAIHNSAVDKSWDGGSMADPYGSPNTPA